MSASVASNKVSEISSRIERLPFSTWQVKALDFRHMRRPGGCPVDQT